MRRRRRIGPRRLRALTSGCAGWSCSVRHLRMNVRTYRSLRPAPAHRASRRGTGSAGRSAGRRRSPKALSDDLSPALGGGPSGVGVSWMEGLSACPGKPLEARCLGGDSRHSIRASGRRRLYRLPNSGCRTRRHRVATRLVRERRRHLGGSEPQGGIRGCFSVLPAHPARPSGDRALESERAAAVSRDARLRSPVRPRCHRLVAACPLRGPRIGFTERALGGDGA